MASSGTTLAPEIWDNICAYLTPPSLANLRLASPEFNNIALPWKYRSIRLEAFGPSVERFISIAKTPNLRNLVREITIDTRVDLEWDYARNDNYPFPLAFMNALPYLRYFTSVTSNTAAIKKNTITCLWTLEKQLQIDEELDQERGAYDGELYQDEDPDDWDRKCDYSDQDVDFRGSCFALRELTISNLADYADPHISDSKAWQTIMALPTLVDFKLFVVAQVDQDSPWNELFFIELYDFFDSLPTTWLSLNMSQNLRVLSLYFEDYWGWLPTMHFRDYGHDSPFPQLKVLALGNYVFSHEWQVDWFPMIGKENGSGGLEELYLDDCPILYHARQTAIRDDGYPDPLAIIRAGLESCSHEDYNFYIRWHSVLSQWKDQMKGLKVFRMGRGSWWDMAPRTFELISDDPEYEDLDRNVLDHRLSYNTHRTFACPAPSNQRSRREMWRHGVGLGDDRDTRMMYIEYDIGCGPPSWLEEDSGFEPEEGTADKDDIA